MARPRKIDLEMERLDTLVEVIRGILAGNGPQVQSAVLATLVSMWLSGHRSSNAEMTDRLRSELLTNFTKLICDLTPPHDAVNVTLMSETRPQ